MNILITAVLLNIGAPAYAEGSDNFTRQISALSIREIRSAAVIGEEARISPEPAAGGRDEWETRFIPALPTWIRDINKGNEFNLKGDANVLIQYEPRTHKGLASPGINGQSLSRPAKDIVAGEFGLPLLRVGITGDEARRQGLLPGTAVPFETALRSAMTSFLEDYTDEESPLSLVIDEVFTGMGENAPLLPYPPQVVEKARARLDEYLNRESAELRLLSVEERAEHGEGVVENWIFFLWIPELSDHGHWAVIKRSGGGQAYNYGFN